MDQTIDYTEMLSKTQDQLKLSNPKKKNKKIIWPRNKGTYIKSIHGKIGSNA
jgi:hypothetical protein